MDEKKLREILKGTIEQITEALASLTPPEVIRLQELEIEEGQREDVVNAIDAYIAAQESAASKTKAGEGGKKGASKKQPADKEARGEEQPDWQKEHYTGPLAIEQANWRNANIIRK